MLMKVTFKRAHMPNKSIEIHQMQMKGIKLPKNITPMPVLAVVRSV
jgi:hypothetical protein